MGALVSLHGMDCLSGLGLGRLGFVVASVRSDKAAAFARASYGLTASLARVAKRLVERAVPIVQALEPAVLRAASLSTADNPAISAAMRDEIDRETIESDAGI